MADVVVKETSITKFFLSLMNADQRAQYEMCQRRANVTTRKVQNFSDLDLAEHVEYCHKNCVPSQYPKGYPVYDSEMYHILIPELIRRLRSKSNDSSK